MSTTPEEPKRPATGRPFVSGDPRAKQWKPGQSGNPGGRARGLTRLIRHETRDGAELAEFMLKLFRQGPLKLRVEAATWLADRGFGRPVQAHTITREEVEHLTEEVSTVVAGVVELYVDPDTLLKIKTKLTALVEQAKAWAGEA